MEKALIKLARQLAAYDEASLVSLWDKYAEIVSRFEPSKRWEEAAVILGLIQAMRFKNQLFNYHWAEGNGPAHGPHPALAAPPSGPHAAPNPDEKRSRRSSERAAAQRSKLKAAPTAAEREAEAKSSRKKVLQFPPKDD